MEGGKEEVRRTGRGKVERKEVGGKEGERWKGRGKVERKM